MGQDSKSGTNPTTKKPQRLADVWKKVGLTPEEINVIEYLLKWGGKKDTPQGFILFYMHITRGRMPNHAKIWIRDIYEKKAEDRGSLIFAFRGSWKTTTISQIFTAFRMGHEAWKSNLILQVNDDAAQKTTLAIAELIKMNPAWMDIFPSVVPDKRKGWGAKGYWIRDNSIDDAEWAARIVISKDPSLLGLGITSGSVIGKHPTGVLLMDDIHDQENTASALERAKVLLVVTDTVLPMAVTDATMEEGQQLQTWTLTVGTPWHEEDAYHYLKDTGEFGYLYSPLIYPVKEGDPGAVYFDHKKLEGWYRLAWEDHIPYESVISLYNKSGHRGFGRMYLLSLIAAMDLGLPFQSFPKERIDELSVDYDLEYCGGVDYASMIEVRGKTMDTRNRSLFALAYGCILPQRVFVITGGMTGHFTQMSAEGKVEATQARFKRYRTTGVEMNGKGEEFFQVLARRPELDLLPYWTGKQEKTRRHEMQLGPWLEMGKIMISDEDTPFLNDLRRALWEFPHGNLDILDAVYGVAQTIPDILVVNKKPKGRLPTPEGHEERKPNPFASFGEGRRYAN
jgi:hypothetical protein